MKSNIFITGFSGTGKTAVGAGVARRLGFRFVDVDDEIVQSVGKPVEAIFAEMGEAHFRRLERRHLAEIAARDQQVVSTGGGMVANDRNRRLMEENGVVVCLEALPETIYARLVAEEAGRQGPVVRPMISGSEPLARIRSLKARRQAKYALAHWTVHTDRMSESQVADEVIRGWSTLVGSTSAGAGDEGDLAAVVRTSSGDYPIWVGWGAIEQLGERTSRVLGPSTAYVITDEGVHGHARRAQMALESAGIATHMFQVPPGEGSKTLETAGLIYRWLAERKAERGHLVVAVGGGMVGDLAGFVAATYLRGMPVVQVPTSLLAMMDAAIGGKVAIDLAQGKNLVGAFHQPKFVLADPMVLETLPKRELTSGWAEAIKHGLIMDEELVATFERRRESVLALEPEIATEVLRRSVEIKANVVSQDEKETLGIRALLNYGHTIGHAIEAVTGYRRFLHGEAVSVGMMGAAYIGHSLGLLAEDDVERQSSLFESFGLPLSFGKLDTGKIDQAMLSDKKRSGKVIHWVLLDGIGNAVTRSDVPGDAVQEALTRLAR